MSNSLPPAPIKDPMGSYTWEEWFRKLRNRTVESLTSVSWSGIDFTGSNITSIVSRDHNNLTNIQGGTSAEYYHLTSNQNDVMKYINGGSPGEGWNDVTNDFAAAKVTGASQPTWAAFRSGIYAYSFSASAMNEAWVNFHITHDYKSGTTVYPHIHWSTTGTNTGTVRFGIEYSVAKGHNQGAFPASTTVYIEQAASGTAYQHMIAEVSDGDSFSTNIEPDSLVITRIFRDAAHANDTCTDAVFILFADIHYKSNRFNTKNKVPNFYT